MQSALSEKMMGENLRL